ncbi:MAG: TatD family hydrolase [Bacteroidales bacterium]|nr:TatD family hydrolase [Bacteroidales bacterium]MBN2698810.1 TatD family hydrolase [Bacteroidales bacterium]
MQSGGLIYLNIHSHRPEQTGWERAIQNIFARDYLPEKCTGGAFSVGLHPYHTGTAGGEEAIRRVRLATDNMNVCAVGETGLDRSIEIPFEQQARVFKLQVEIAESAGLPVILHVVKAFNEMIRFMKQDRPVVPMVVHGYKGGPQMVRELVRAGFLVSFGEAITGRHGKVKEALRSVPADRFFLETDESERDIREIYRVASEIRQIPVEALCFQMLENARYNFKRFIPEQPGNNSTGL